MHACRALLTDIDSFGIGRLALLSSTTVAISPFVMCAAYYITYLPVVIRLALSEADFTLPEAAQFTAEWIYHSSAAVNGFLYIALHSSVRRELRRYLPRCRHNTVAPATIQLVGDGGRRRHCVIVNPVAGAPGAPVPMMRSSRQLNTERLLTTVV